MPPTIRYRGRRVFDFLVAKRLQGNIGSFGNGDTFYVDGISGSDGAANGGNLPTSPLLTIDRALELATTEHDDYIFVMDCWSSGEPIEVDKSLVHIIALNNPQAPWAALNAGADTAIFTASSAGNSSEISGFNIGGGNSHAGIETTNCIGLWIHHNAFGHPFSSDTPLYGIWNGVAGNPAYCLIEDNRFYGDGKSDGDITSNGIYIHGSLYTMVNGIIRRNVFLGLVGATNAGAIYLSAVQGAEVSDNIFHFTDAANGDAINLGSTTRHCIIEGNRASHGMLNAGNTYNPYRDLATNTLNGWGLNYRNNSVMEPVGV